tara:strand:- start:162 stop:956 length:795 start_codon:yes stop_codon:yes gene_type:complete
MEVLFRILLSKALILIALVGFSATENLSLPKNNISDSSKTQKVLMIGNSFTFYWNLPQVLECMFSKRNENIEVDQKTIGGSNLAKHWRLNNANDYSIDNYEYLVLNDHSTNPLLNIDSCAKYIKLFAELARKNQTVPFVYGTWEYPYLKEISKKRTSNTMDILDSLSRINNATYIPVGNAFRYVEQNYPEINLYMDDDKHPSSNATYLASCVFYSMITGKSPIGLPRRFEGKNIDGKKIYYIITEKNIAPIIQKVANIVTKDLR